MEGKLESNHGTECSFLPQCATNKLNLFTGPGYNILHAIPGNKSESQLSARWKGFQPKAKQTLNVQYQFVNMNGINNVYFIFSRLQGIWGFVGFVRTL